MTLTAKVLPLTQIDTTLVDVRLYVKMLSEARKLKSGYTFAAVMYVIGVAYENANDTVFMEREREPGEWAMMFEGTLASFSVDALHTRTSGTNPVDRANRRALKWFANRGIRG